MSQSYDYRTLTLPADNADAHELQMDAYVQKRLTEVEEHGWMYYSGPTIYTEVSGTPVYVFTIRRDKDERSAYEDHGVDVL